MGAMDDTTNDPAASTGTTGDDTDVPADELLRRLAEADPAAAPELAETLAGRLEVELDRLERPGDGEARR